jgi:putative lipoic acid-binding regulatory protein
MNETTSDNKSIYPCLLPIKVIGKNTQLFQNVILEIVADWVSAEHRQSIQQVESKAGSYASLTIHVQIQNREHMEIVFQDLQSRTEVVMVL